MAEVVFAKERGKERKDNAIINIEEFISIKGINALGNQLTKEKINQINILDSIPYEAPEDTPAEDIEVVDEETLKHTTNDTATSKVDPSSNGIANTDSKDFEADEEGQITLF